jgi:PhnB protein
LQIVTPYLLYEDAAAAIDWLSRVFGFEERLRYEDESGTVTHAELVLGEGTIFLGYPGPDYRSPRKLGAFTDLTHVYVEDVDAHFARARDAGAKVHAEPEDQVYGDRRYDAEDLEGHRWSFAQLLRDVPAEEWGATTPAR